MTTRHEKPTFLARLAIIVTVSAIAWQFFFLSTSSFRELNSTGTGFSKAHILVGLAPFLVFSAIAAVYYLFMGKPANSDAIIARRLYLTWAISVITGFACSFFIKISQPDPFKF